MKRITEMGFNNFAQARHDAFGNYLDHNGIRTYSVTVPIEDGQAYDTTKIPAGSMARTSHQNGREMVFIANESSGQWQSMFAPTVSGVKAYGEYDFTDGADLVANVSRLFNGVTFSWVATPTTAVQAQLVTETETTGNTVLGENLANMVQKLNANANGLVTLATYSTNQTAGGKDGTKILVVHKTAGTSGNLYTLGSADDAYGTRSGATLAHGANPASP